MKKYSIITLILLMFALLPGVAGAAGNSVTGKNVALIGDSMTWIGGDSCDIARGWTSHFRRLASPASMNVYARSGATWTNAPDTKVDTEAFYDVLHDDNVLYTQAVRLVTDVRSGVSRCPDLIILYAGANDAWFASRRPGIFTAGSTTADGSLPASLAGSVRAVCGLLRENLPDSRMILVTPAQMTKAPASAVERVSAVIDSVGRSLGLQVIRTDRDGPINAAEERGRHPRLTSDGIHTNPEGAAELARFFIREIGRYAEE